MLSYIFKRILSLIPVLLVVSCVAFLIVYMIPGGPATALLGMEATPEQIHTLNAELGFDRPFLTQYVDWFGKVLQGDWGTSYFLHQSVLEAIAEYFPPTLSLAILAQIIALRFRWGFLLPVKEELRWMWQLSQLHFWGWRFRGFCLVCF